MRTTDRYVYKLVATWRENGADMEEVYEVHPMISKMEVKHTRPSDEMHYEEQFDSDFVLNGDECRYVTDRNVSTRFVLRVIETEHRREVSRCNFRKSDCEIDLNHKEVRVNPKSDNPYELLKGRLDEEVDIKPLRPEMKTLSYKIRPSVQFYMIGSSYALTTSASGTSQVEVRIEGLTDGQLTGCGFIRSNYYFDANVNVSGSSHISGSYNVSQNVGSTSANRISLDGGGMRLEMYVVQSGSDQYIGYRLMYGNMQLQTYTPDSTLWENRFGVLGYSFTFQPFMYAGEEVTARVSSLSCRSIYARVLVANAPDATGRTNLEMVDNVIDSGVYKFAYGLHIAGSNVVLSTSGTTKITEYGRMNSTQYYEKPAGLDGYEPVGQDAWFGNQSVWVDSMGIINSILSNTYYRDRTMTLGDWYSFGSVLKVVLSYLDERIDFDETTEYSRFLFGLTNPIVGESEGMLLQGRLYMLQKSNLLTLDYDVASNNNKVTLRKMLQFLKYALNCYWSFQQYVDDNGKTRYKFKVEHVYYFMNGGTYTTEDDPRAIIDLTKMRDEMNGRKLSMNTNRWSYDIGSGMGTSTKIQYHWMDRESAAFDGYDLEVPEDSRVLTNDVVEDRTIDWFSSDIDYLLSNSEDCSKEGYLIVWTESNASDVVPIDNDRGSVTYRMQNYRLAISWLMQHILLYNIGSKYVKINNKSANTRIMGVKSMRRAEVQFMPLRGMIVKPDEYKVRTEVGDGVINSMTTDLTSGLVSAELLYELED